MTNWCKVKEGYEAFIVTLMVGVLIMSIAGALYLLYTADHTAGIAATAAGIVILVLGGAGLYIDHKCDEQKGGA